MLEKPAGPIGTSTSCLHVRRTASMRSTCVHDETTPRKQTMSPTKSVSPSIVRQVHAIAASHDAVHQRPLSHVCSHRQTRAIHIPKKKSTSLMIAHQATLASPQHYSSTSCSSHSNICVTMCRQHVQLSACLHETKTWWTDHHFRIDGRHKGKDCGLYEVIPEMNGPVCELCRGALQRVRERRGAAREGPRVGWDHGDAEGR